MDVGYLLNDNILCGAIELKSCIRKYSTANINKVVKIKSGEIISETEAK
jgi:hypothetical protein